MSRDGDWIELEEGFYIVEESGGAESARGMREQADDNYDAVKEAFEGKIKFTDGGEPSNESSQNGD